MTLPNVNDILQDRQERRAMAREMMDEFNRQFGSFRFDEFSREIGEVIASQDGESKKLVREITTQQKVLLKILEEQRKETGWLSGERWRLTSQMMAQKNQMGVFQMGARQGAFTEDDLENMSRSLMNVLDERHRNLTGASARAGRRAGRNTDEILLGIERATERTAGLLEKFMNDDKQFRTSGSGGGAGNTHGDPAKGLFGDVLKTGLFSSIAAPLGVLYGFAKFAPVLAPVAMKLGTALVVLGGGLSAIWLALGAGTKMMGEGLENTMNFIAELPEKIEGFIGVPYEKLGQAGAHIGNFFGSLGEVIGEKGIVASLAGSYATSVANIENIKELMNLLGSLGDLNIDTDKVRDVAWNINSLTSSFDLIGSLMSNTLNVENLNKMSAVLESMSAKSLNLDNIRSYTQGLISIGNALSFFSIGGAIGSKISQGVAPNLAEDAEKIANMRLLTEADLDKLSNYVRAIGRMGDAVSMYSGVWSGLGSFITGFSEQMFSDGRSSFLKLADDINSLYTKLQTNDVNYQQILDFGDFLGNFGEKMGAYSWQRLGQSILDLSSNFFRAIETLGGNVRSYNEATFDAFSNLSTLDPDKISRVGHAMLAFSAQQLGSSILNNINQMATAFGELFRWVTGSESSIDRLVRIGSAFEQIGSVDFSKMANDFDMIFNRVFTDDKMERVEKFAQAMVSFSQAASIIASMPQDRFDGLQDTVSRLVKPIVMELNASRTSALQEQSQLRELNNLIFNPVAINNSRSNRTVVSNNATYGFSPRPQPTPGSFSGSVATGFNNP